MKTPYVTGELKYGGRLSGCGKCWMWEPTSPAAVMWIL